MPHTQGSPEPAPAAPVGGITVRPPVLVAMTQAEWEEATRLLALMAPDEQTDAGTAA